MALELTSKILNTLWGLLLSLLTTCVVFLESIGFSPREPLEHALSLFPGLPRQILSWKTKKIPKQYRLIMLRRVLADLKESQSPLDRLRIAVGFGWADTLVPDIPDEIEE